MPEDQSAAAETATGEQPAYQEPSPDDNNATNSDSKPEVDWKSKAREWEKRAKANAEAASKLSALEESQKTESQKLADSVTAAKQEAAEARMEALRYRTATKFGITDEDAETFLTGTDEETIVRQAQRLVVLQKPGTPQPDPSQGSRGPATAGNMNELIRSGLNRR